MTNREMEAALADLEERIANLTVRVLRDPFLQAQGRLADERLRELKEEFRRNTFLN